MPAKTIREQLTEMLLKWRDGAITERDVHEAAEDLFERLERGSRPSGDEMTQEALVHLDALPQQWITVDNVPAIIKLLQTPSGEEALGLGEWGAYCDSIDFRKRAQQLAANPYYSKSWPYTG
jgi:hypothetical protein